MNNDIKIKCTFSDIKHNSKPTGRNEIAEIQLDLKPTDITIAVLAKQLVYGASFRPGVLYGRKKSD